MGRRVGLWCIWFSFVAYTIRLAPLDRAYTWYLGRKLITLQWSDINAYIPAIFSLMGVMPVVYACLMFVDGRMQPFRAWTYFAGSNFTGVICLLPYLLFRRRNQAFYGTKNIVLQLLDRHSTGIALLVSAIALITYAIVVSDWEDYVQQFYTQPFVHLISLDFCLICLIFPITDLFDDDMARRNVTNARFFWSLALIPLFGSLIYLCLRPPLGETQPNDRSNPSYQLEATSR